MRAAGGRWLAADSIVHCHLMTTAMALKARRVHCGEGPAQYAILEHSVGILQDLLHCCTATLMAFASHVCQLQMNYIYEI